MHIVGLYRYPVKGFSPEPLQSALVEAGGTMPFDRAFAVENGPSGFDADAPTYLRKIYFLMLMKHERIAEFETRFDETDGAFRISRAGAHEIEASLYTAEGRALIEEWIAANFRDELRGRPKILSAPGHSFSDMKAKVLHLVNMASVRAFEAQIGRPVDPLRFRPNIVIDGAPAFAELEWAEREITLPNIRLAGDSLTGRCAAPDVDPKKGRRDMKVPQALAALYGHSDFGIYVVARTSGSIAVGDALDATAAKAARPA